MKTYSIIVKGMVQGVFFRQSTKEKAELLGLTGKVMNLPNGDVQVIVTGENEPIAELIEWCRKGPPRATVDSVDSRELPLEQFSRFQVVRY